MLRPHKLSRSLSTLCNNHYPKIKPCHLQVVLEIKFMIGVNCSQRCFKVHATLIGRYERCFNDLAMIKIREPILLYDVFSYNFQKHQFPKASLKELNDLRKAKELLSIY